MSALARERKTYRGGSLEELLPQIRTELGGDAVITKQREGVIGGVGGFFGKKCIEVEVEGTPVRGDLLPEDKTFEPVARVLPARFAVNAYDTGDPLSDSSVSPLLAELRAQAAPFLLEDEEEAPEAGEPAAPQAAAQPVPPSFADHLAAAESGAAPLLTQWIPAEPELGLELEPVQAAAPAPAEPAAEPAPLPELPAASWPADLEWLTPYGHSSRPEAPALEEADVKRSLLAIRRPQLPSSSGDAGIRFALDAAAIPEAVSEVVLREVDVHMRPFMPYENPRAQARRALSRRLKVRTGWRSKRRTIAILGPAGAGRTLLVSRLCHAYARRSTLSVGVVSLEPVRTALRLGSLVEPLSVELGVAESAAEVVSAVGRMGNLDLVVADTPALDDDAASSARLASLLHALQPDEVHLAVPATLDAAAVERLLERASKVAKIDALVLTRLDEAAGAPQAIGVSLTARLPISFLSDGDRPHAGLRPAEPEDLAELVL